MERIQLEGGYSIDRDGRLHLNNGYSMPLSGDRLANIVAFAEAGKVHKASIKAKRYWYNMRHDPAAV